MNVFESNAAELEKLREHVKQVFKRRSENQERTAAWQEAAKAFHESYDKLAFPGGLNREFDLLKLGDLQAIEMAVEFLEADPWYFRSGYQKADILKLLGKQPLTEDQCVRLRKVILERVRGRPVREMRAYGRLAPKVSNPQFEAELTNIARNSNRRAVRHAGLVLEYLAQKKSSARK